MDFMKKIATFLIGIFICVISYTQAVPNAYAPKTNITINAEPSGWAKFGTACATCPSFFYRIERTNAPVMVEDGIYYYYYYFYFFSNSFDANGQPASTYISDVNFFINNNVILNVPYILVPPSKSVYAAWIRHVSPNMVVSFRWQKVSVY